MSAFKEELDALVDTHPRNRIRQLPASEAVRREPDTTRRRDIMAEEIPASTEEALNEPYFELTFEVKCPMNENRLIPIDLGWVGPRNYPTLHLNAPKLQQHLQIHDLGGGCVNPQQDMETLIKELQDKRDVLAHQKAVDSLIASESE